MARPGVIGGDPPRPAAVGGRKPHVVVGDERYEITVNMRKAQVPG